MRVYPVAEIGDACSQLSRQKWTNVSLKNGGNRLGRLSGGKIRMPRKVVLDPASKREAEGHL